MLKIGSIAFAMAASTCCLAQESAPIAADISPLPQAASVQSKPGTAGECCRIVDGTPVTLEILEPLNSSLLKRGDKFKLRLAGPVAIDNQALLAAGIEGAGEVIHAEKSRGGGKAGELLIAARYLDHEGVQVRLRGLKLGGSGKDNTGAALATALVVGPFAHFVHGREIVIPAGTLVQAKIAGDIVLSPMQQSPARQATAAAMPGSASNLASDAASDPSMPQGVATAPPATATEIATPQQPTVETTQEPKE